VDRILTADSKCAPTHRQATYDGWARTYVNSRKDEERYRAAPSWRFSLGAAVDMLFLPLDQTALVYPKGDAALLNVCTQFQTLSEHASRIEQGLGTACDAELLSAFAREGALLSYSELMRRVEEAPRDELVHLNCVTIPTRDRPAQLAQALNSYAASTQRSGHRPTFFVADDSKDGAQRAANKKVADDAAVAYEVDVLYSGNDEKQAYLCALTESGDLPHPVVRFALFGPDGVASTYGANRNAILLQTSGARFLSVDDDTLCRIATAPDLAGLDMIKIGVEADPTEFWFFPDRSKALETVKWGDVDLIAEHERLLGRSLSGVSQAAAESKRVLDLTCPHQFLDLCQAQGRIRITISGSIGDSCFHSGEGFLATTNPSTRDRLVSSPESFRTALTSREVLRVTASSTVGHILPCIAACIGLDNTELLPPFFPVGRSEDGTFGLTVQKCVPHAYAGRLPWAVLHSPPDLRNNPAGVPVRICDIISASISTWTGGQPNGSTDHHLTALGRHLHEVAGLDALSFKEYLRLLLWQRASQQIATYESLLDRYGGMPEFWAEEVVKRIHSTRSRVTDPTYPLPIDIGEGPDDAWTKVRGLIGMFAELLCWWPSIVEKAKDLRARGIELGVKPS
jgi:hypothetical protein